MKTIGLLGGMSWESTLEYYRIINRAVGERLGGFHSAKILLYSVDFDEIERLQQQGRWEESGARLGAIAKTLELAGADLLILCTNTMHKVADWIEKATAIPFIHIADATAQAIVGRNFKKVGLLGTRYTMEEDFYKSVLVEKYGLDVVIPPAEERSIVNDVIFNELCRGVVSQSSKQRLVQIAEALIASGAQGIILGCTEIPLLIKEADCPVPLFDTTSIHALRAVDHALND